MFPAMPKNAEGRGQAPQKVSGTQRALVLLVDFSDKISITSSSYFDTLVFSSTPGDKSVRNYYKEISYNTVDIVTVDLPSSLGWTRMPQAYSYYANGENGFGAYPRNAQKLVEDAVDAANPTVDFSQYDNDGDGRVDILFVVHAGTGAELTGNVNDIWSHAWSITARSVDGVTVSRYSMEPEFWFAAGDMTRGVFAHELGHVFGLPDLYDYGYDSRGLGSWSLMAGGSWGGWYGDSPAHPDAWSRYKLGFVSPINVTTPMMGVAIPPVENGPGSVYRLPVNGAPSSEYFLVENRQQIGSDASIPGSGLMVYHVDEGRPNNDDQSRYLVDVEEAHGGEQHLQADTNGGDSGDSFPGTSGKTAFNDLSDPNSKAYNSAVTDVEVSGISAVGATIIADLFGTAVGDNDIPGIPLPPSPVSGSLDIATDPNDVFGVNLSAGQQMLATITGPAGTDFDMYLYPPGSADITSPWVARAFGTTYPDSFTYTAPAGAGGTYYLRANAWLGSGNYSITYSSDNTPPTTTLETSPTPADGDSGWFKTVPAITLNRNEAGSTYMQFDSTAPLGFVTGDTTSAPEGQHTLYYYSVDTAGNTETVKNQVFKVDTVKPIDPSISSPSHTEDATSTDSTIDMFWPEATDAGSGIAGYSFDWTQNAIATPDTNVDPTGIDFNSPTIASGYYHTVGFKEDGTVVAVGSNSDGQTNVSGWTDIKAVAAGGYYTVGLKEDGTVVAMGSNYFGQTNVSGWTDIKAIAAGVFYTVGLKEDGTVVAVGANDFGQTNVSGWTNIKAIAAGYSHTVGLKEDGTVVAVGRNTAGQTNVSGWTDIKAIAAGQWHTVGVKEDGTVVAVGSNSEGQTNVSGWTDIKAIAAGNRHTVGLKEDGTVVAMGWNINGQTNVSGWTDIKAVAAGGRHTVGLKTDGTVVAVGYNSDGQTDVSGWADIRQPGHIVTSSPLSAGTWYFNLRTKDVTGNWTATVHAGPYRITVIDNTPPITTLETSPTPADGDSGWFKTTPAITLNRNEAGTTYMQFDSTASLGFVTGDTTSAPEGQHTIYYYSVDTAGNTETVKNQVFEVDTTDPIDPSISSPSHTEDAISTDSTIDMDIQGATDTISGVEGYSVSWSQDTTELPDATVDMQQSDNSTTSPALSSGTWYFNLRTKDVAGNWTATVHAGPYWLAVVDNTPPTTTLQTSPAPADGDDGWFKTTPTITLNRNEVGTTYMQFDSTASLGFVTGDTTSAPEGQHTIYYYSVDTAGNTETVKNQVFEVDTTDPIDPSISSPSHTEDAISTDSTIDMDIQGATDTISGVEGYSVSWSQDTTELPDATVDMQQSDNSTTSPALSSGTWYFNLRTKDVAGNWTATVHAGPYMIEGAQAAWTPQVSGTGNTLYGVHFNDVNNGWAVGYSTPILKTTNGGTNWVPQEIGRTRWLYDVYFADANVGWAVGAWGTILKTTNGGTTWLNQYGASGDLRAVYFVDTNTGFAVGASGQIIKTTNGGANWAAKTSGTSNNLYDVDFTDANTGFAVGYSGTILKTTNGGTTWVLQTSGTGQGLWDVDFTDTNTGFAVGNSGTILKTANGGTTWVPQTSGTSNGLSSVRFTDANTGFAAGNSGTILNTTNGGTTWTSQTSGTGNNIEDVHFIDANSGWAVGSGGTILKR